MGVHLPLGNLTGGVVGVRHGRAPDPRPDTEQALPTWSRPRLIFYGLQINQLCGSCDRPWEVLIDDTGMAVCIDTLY